mgnify:CR=1 FL=1
MMRISDKLIPESHEHSSTPQVSIPGSAWSRPVDKWFVIGCFSIMGLMGGFMLISSIAFLILELLGY